MAVILLLAAVCEEWFQHLGHQIENVTNRLLILTLMALGLQPQWEDTMIYIFIFFDMTIRRQTFFFDLVCIFCYIYVIQLSLTHLLSLLHMIVEDPAHITEILCFELV